MDKSEYYISSTGHIYRTMSGPTKFSPRKLLCVIGWDEVATGIVMFLHREVSID